MAQLAFAALTHISLENIYNQGARRYWGNRPLTDMEALSMLPLRS
jgi:hypothetical protein